MRGLRAAATGNRGVHRPAPHGGGRCGPATPRQAELLRRGHHSSTLRPLGGTRGAGLAHTGGTRGLRATAMGTRGVGFAQRLTEKAVAGWSRCTRSRHCAGGGQDSPCEGARRAHGKHKSEEREEIVSGATRSRAITPRSGQPLAATRTLPIHAKLRASVGAHKTQQVTSQEGLGGGVWENGVGNCVAAQKKA